MLHTCVRKEERLKVNVPCFCLKKLGKHTNQRQTNEKAGNKIIMIRTEISEIETKVQ